MKKTTALLLLAVCFSFQTVTAEDRSLVSEKKDVTLFSVSDPRSLMNPAYALRLREMIQGGIEKLGRFSVQNYQIRGKSMDVEKFIEGVKDLRSQAVQIPEEVRLGNQVFTRQDFDRLTGGFILCIPELTGLQVLKDEEKQAKILLTVDLLFLRGEDLSTAGRISLSTAADDLEWAESEDKAFRDSITQMISSLEQEIRKIKEFRLRTGIIDFKSGDPIIELGSAMGILPGDEYELVRKTGGIWEDDSTGLIMIDETREGVSRAKILFGDFSLGDQLQEVYREETDFQTGPAFGNKILMEPLQGADSVHNQELMGLYNFKTVFTRGSTGIRGYVKIVFPFYDYRNYPFFPNVWEEALGGDFSFFLGRLQDTLSLQTGFAFWSLNFGSGPEWITWFPYGGLGAEASLSWLLSRDVKIGASAGADAYWSRPDLNPAFRSFYRTNASVFLTLKG